jgi:ubiquitin-protein ligase
MATYIRQEMEEIEDSPELDEIGCSIGQENTYDVYNWKASFIGPSTSAYHGGLFRLSINFPEDYPKEKPNIKFKTKIYHPNIDYDDGSICIESLNNWTSSTKMKEVLYSIYCLLITPNPDSYLNEDAALLLKKDRDAFKSRANQDVRLYALI